MNALASPSVSETRSAPPGPGGGPSRPAAGRRDRHAGEGAGTTGRSPPDRSRRNPPAPPPDRSAVLREHLEAHQGVARPGVVARHDQVGRVASGAIRKRRRASDGSSPCTRVGMAAHARGRPAPGPDQVADRDARPDPPGRRADRPAHRVVGRVGAEVPHRAVRSPAGAAPQRRAVTGAGEDQLVSPAEPGLQVRQDRARSGCARRPRPPGGRRAPARLARVVPRSSIGGKVVDRRAEAAVLPPRRRPPAAALPRRRRHGGAPRPR